MSVSPSNTVRRWIEAFRLARLHLILRLLGFQAARPANPDGERSVLEGDDLSDLRTVDPQPDMYAAALYDLPKGPMALRLTNETRIVDGFDYRRADVIGDTFAPLDDSDPPRELWLRQRHTNTDFRDDWIAIVPSHQTSRGLIGIGVFMIRRQRAR